MIRDTEQGDLNADSWKIAQVLGTEARQSVCVCVCSVMSDSLRPHRNASLESPALTGGFFTTEPPGTVSWQAPLLRAFLFVLLSSPLLTLKQ